MEIITPVPKSPFIDMKTGYVTREWYRFLASLTQAVGGSTNIIVDLDISTSGGEPADLGPTETLAQEADAYGSQNAGLIAAIMEGIYALNPQVSGAQELGPVFSAVQSLTPFGMPPTELGSLYAAQNLGYRVIAAGNAVLVAGTKTVNSIQANSAKEFMLTAKVVGGTQGILSVGTIVADTSFVINSSNAADTSTVSWVILGAIRG